MPAKADRMPDTPGGFKRLMIAKEIAEKKALEKKNKKDQAAQEVCLGLHFPILNPPILTRMPDYRNLKLLKSAQESE